MRLLDLPTSPVPTSFHILPSMSPSRTTRWPPLGLSCWSVPHPHSSCCSVHRANPPRASSKYLLWVEFLPCSLPWHRPTPADCPGNSHIQISASLYLRRKPDSSLPCYHIRFSLISLYFSPASLKAELYFSAYSIYRASTRIELKSELKAPFT